MLRYLNAIAIILLLFVASCSAPKKVIYFNQDTPNDTTVAFQPLQSRPEVVIQSDDILAITVSSTLGISDKDPVGMFNNGGTQYSLTAMSNGVGGGAAGTNVSGYLVDREGNIDFPIVGKFHVAGLTLRQMKGNLSDKLKTYLTNPVVEARIINFKVTILGEVARVGPVIAPNQRMNIIEAISAAGDIPVTGRRDNVLIIRERDGKREFGRINMNSKNAFTSPYYFLEQNDIVYVEPARVRRQETNDFLRFYLPTITTFLSTALAVYGIVELTK
ncbi:polysaccharide biosynthesis/export family protein [Taibaiella soli]|uniref:Sugar transporter n=1 Tax=Taibaiella soli TaxID=1649169 RepID=A0A2W2AWH6_9BACT|nr:polysaccharide biosynthesis/export family protein [Taibaiella soli]PZF72048.1 sugar transporter [Taibaiella soli]